MDKIKENAYIYGIRIDNELVYIGKTFRPIAQRLEEHALLNGHNQQLEEAMSKNNYDFVILYKSHNAISNEELEQIEKSLIENIKPKYNILGVTKPYKLYSTKTNYKYKKDRRYVGLIDLEVSGLLELNPLLIDSPWYGSILSLSNNFYKAKIFQKPDRENFYLAFGKPNNYTDPVWSNYGPMGLCFKTTFLANEDNNIRLLTKEEMTKGLPKDCKLSRHSSGVIAFPWISDINEEIIQMRNQQVIAFQNKDYDQAFGIEAILYYSRAEELVKNPQDLAYRMSLLQRPTLQPAGSNPDSWLIVADDPSYYGFK